MANKYIFFFFIILFVFSSCDKYIPFDISSNSINLTCTDDHSFLKNTFFISTTASASDITFFSNDPYIATIDNWRIEAQHIGETEMHFSDGKTTRVCKVAVVPSQTYPVEPILDFSLKKSKITSILNESDETTVNDNIVSQTVDYVSYNYFFSGDSFSHLEITWDYFSFVMHDDYILLKERYEPYQGHSNKYVDRYNTFTIERKLGSHIYKPI